MSGKLKIPKWMIEEIQENCEEYKKTGIKEHYESYDWAATEIPGTDLIICVPTVSDTVHMRQPYNPYMIFANKKTDQEIYPHFLDDGFEDIQVWRSGGIYPITQAELDLIREYLESPTHGRKWDREYWMEDYDITCWQYLIYIWNTNARLVADLVNRVQIEQFLEGRYTSDNESFVPINTPVPHWKV